ncbi:MAG: DsbA family protein [Mycobacterium sp.]
MPERPPTETSRRRDLVLLAAAIVIALIIVVVLVVRQYDSGTPASAAGPATSTATSATVGTPAVAPLGPLGDLARRQPNDPMAQGSVTAPVTFIEFADFRCPFCAQFARTTEPHLIDKYVNDGVLRIEWRDMPIFGEQSLAAARAGRAAAAQGRFWQFVNAVYQAAPPKGHPDLTPAALRGFAQQAGVPDLARFTADAASITFDAAINDDLQVANRFGISSTPAFSVHGTPVLGAQPPEVFFTLIDNLAAGQPASS